MNNLIFLCKLEYFFFVLIKQFPVGCLANLKATVLLQVTFSISNVFLLLFLHVDTACLFFHSYIYLKGPTTEELSLCSILGCKATVHQNITLVFFFVFFSYDHTLLITHSQIVTILNYGLFNIGTPFPPDLAL